MTYRERRLARADRLRVWADTRQRNAAAVFKAGEPFTSDIAFNTQPGHIPFRARLIAREDRAFESLAKASAMDSRAVEIERQADRAIYDDDPDVVDRLEEKLAWLEARRETMKATNAEYRRTHKAELKAMDAYDRGRSVPHPSWEVSNLGGVITTTRKRLERLRAEKTSVGSAVVASSGGAPLERAGLVITATMTTPAKAWKKPRAVWTVSGNLAFWRPVLVDELGGTLYRGVVSFWSDPTADIVKAVEDAETPATEEAVSETYTETCHADGCQYLGETWYCVADCQRVA